ncbi:membrane fusion protein, multidrug efflux system [Terrimicrobium sacchariphilum]|uniref:Membrane fusion protein, multidrug efflux system n=1 Tax=Terrimicrobium sacchariphilum TaxID=690879 RepID=A0A146G705_TERSA|nr:efflux RND transporter periplasmic adaptor subunit [Terrimicrobium sacchariphilum]GAT33162.1 membrane fusion protein, multidrug efflux system [Terrimicrobium sacchariphilum]
MKCWELRTVASVLIVMGLVGCGPKPVATKPLPPATYAVAAEQNVPLTINTFGNCVTVADVTLQAQVTGTLTRFAIQQGALVKEGDLVAEIDPSPFQAALQEAKGSLDSAQAQLANADVTLQRQQQLYKTKTIDLADLQSAEANQLQAQGNVLSAQGQLANAQINLAYCTIKSPITGKAGIYMVDAGNLVTASKTELINIQTIDPIYVDFTVSENDFNTIRKYFTNGELPIEVTIPGAPDKVIPGKLTFINNSVASDTGTLSLRGTFPNADALLWPGLFVNVSLILTTVEKAVTVPSMCVMVGQTGPYVFKVNADDTVALQPVTLGQRRSDFAVVTKGVSAGDRIITAGQLGLVTGKKVTPTLWQPPAPLPSRQDAAK